VRDVLSKVRDSREIRRRQAGAATKRAPVKHDRVRARAVRVHCASSCNQNTAMYRHRIRARSTTRREKRGMQQAMPYVVGKASCVG
jgi:hypothetical protein